MGIRFEQEENPVLEEKVPLQILEAAASGKNTEYRLTIGWKKENGRRPLYPPVLCGASPAGRL